MSVYEYFFKDGSYLKSNGISIIFRANDCDFTYVIEKEIEKVYKAIQPYCESKKSTDQVQPTPNCGICEWHIAEVEQGITKNKLKSVCTAQGFKLCAVCYNTDECKKLFKEESDE